MINIKKTNKPVKHNHKKLRANILLLITALIWGMAFTAQSEGMNYLQPFTFNGIRSFISGFVLLAIIPILNRFVPALGGGSGSAKGKLDKKLIIGGIICGCILFVASSLQQYGLVFTTAGKAGFITTLYIVIVPILGIFIRRRVPPYVWVSVAVATVGMYLLSVKDGFKMSPGDLLMLLCAVFFSLHIIFIGIISPHVDSIKLSCIQFFVSGILSLIPMFVFETPKLSAILACALPLIYAGAISGAIGFTMQIIAQRDTDATVASLLMSMESVFAALAGWLILNETLLPKEVGGCALIFIAVVLAQLPQGNKKPKADKSPHEE